MFIPRKKLVRQLEEAGQRIKDLEAWKARAEETFEKSHYQQMELAGEITASLAAGARISRDSWATQGRMDRFERDFQGAFGDLGRIGGQIGDLDRSIASAGTAVNQTSAAIEQITASITQISRESTARYQDIRDLATLSKAGQEEMAATLGVIQGITSGIDDLKAFLEIIDDIAGKTSILSMNAAIQAAHAGEVGKGFAVVADEIRRLAESSAANASAITKQLGGLIESIHRAEESSRKTAAILAQTEVKSAQAAAGFQEIEQGTRELALGSREILDGVGSLRESSLDLQETSATLQDNAGALTGTIGRLRDESTGLDTELRSIRSMAADLNGSGLVLSQTTVRQLEISRSFRPEAQGIDEPLANILVLDHLAWVTRVRGVLDGSLKMGSDAVDTQGGCSLGRHLDGDPRAKADHEAFHALVKETLAAHQGGKPRDENEARYQRLTDLADKTVAAVRSLAERGSDASGKIRWTAALEVGHPVIDPQHRRLVELINQLYDALHTGRAREVLAPIVNELVDYTETHFRDEENLFLNSSYPGKAGHQAQHRKFVETISRFRSDFAAGRVVLGSETMTFLRDWLVNHIQGTDRQIVGYLKKG